MMFAAAARNAQDRIAWKFLRISGAQSIKSLFSATFCQKHSDVPRSGPSFSLDVVYSALLLRLRLPLL